MHCIFFHHEKRLSKGKAIHSPPPNKPNSQLHQLCLLTRSFEGIDCWEGGQSRSDVHIPDNSAAERAFKSRPVCFWEIKFVWSVQTLVLQLLCGIRKTEKEKGGRRDTHMHRPIRSPARCNRSTGRGQTNEHSLLLSSSPFIMLSRTCTAPLLHKMDKHTHTLYKSSQWLQCMPKGSSLQMLGADIWHVLNCSCTGQSVLVTNSQSRSLPSLSPICSLFLQVFSFSGVTVHVTKDSRAHSIHAAPFFWFQDGERHKKGNLNPSNLGGVKWDLNQSGRTRAKGSQRGGGLGLSHN